MAVGPAAETLKLAPRFAAICGQDTFGVMKPDPGHAAADHRARRRRAGEAIMVGDSGTDVRTARAANVPVVAVDFGYSDVPIATLQPDRLISSFADLPAAIDRARSPGGRRNALAVQSGSAIPQRAPHKSGG